MISIPFFLVVALLFFSALRYSLWQWLMAALDKIENMTLNLRGWLRSFLTSTASLVGDYFCCYHELNLQFRGDAVRRNYMLVTFKDLLMLFIFFKLIHWPLNLWQRLLIWVLLNLLIKQAEHWQARQQVRIILSFKPSLKRQSYRLDKTFWGIFD